MNDLKETLWHYYLHGLDYGKDWELMCWENKRIYSKFHLNLRLADLGIKKKYTLEIISHFTKDRAEQVPPAPEAYINYGSRSKIRKNSYQYQHSVSLRPAASPFVVPRPGGCTK